MSRDRGVSAVEFRIADTSTDSLIRLSGQSERERKLLDEQPLLPVDQAPDKIP